MPLPAAVTMATLLAGVRLPASTLSPPLTLAVPSGANARASGAPRQPHGALMPSLPGESARLPPPAAGVGCARRARGPRAGGRKVVRSIRSRPLAAFFVLVFAITWAVWVPRAAGVPVGVVGQLWTWVPAAAALITAALAGGRGALGDLGARLVRWRVGWRWYAVIILGPAIFSLAVAALYA